MQLNIDFTASREAGSTAADACLNRAERVASFDTEGCKLFLVGWLRRHGPMSGEALTDAAKEHGYRPIEDRAFGSLYATLARRNLIRCVGFCTRQKGHGTAGGRTWEAVA